MSQPSWNLADFLRELKRRRVYRVAVVYVTVVFVILEGCSFIFPALLLPDWTFRLLVVLALVGFPIALTLAWAFELTPEGVRRTEAVAPELGVAKWVKAAALFAVTLVAAVGAYWGFLRPDKAEARQKQLVVVAPFVNQTGDREHDVYCYWAADRITQGLAQSNLVMVVDFAQAFVAERNVRTAGIQLGDDAGIRAFAEETLADIVVTGSVYQQGDELLFQATVNDAKTGEVLFGLDPLTGSAEEPRACIESLRDQVMVALAQSVDPTWTTQPIDPDLMTQPQNFDAYREYLAAHESHYIDMDYEAAVDHFDKAAALDTAWLWPVLNNIYPYGHLGEVDKSDSVLSLVDRKRDRLTPWERLWLDAEIALRKGDNQGHLRGKRRATEMTPGDPTAQYNLAYALMVVNRPREALEILNPLRGVLWGIESTLLTQANHYLGEYKDEIEEARRARQVKPDWISPLRWEARGLAALGRVEDVHELIEQSLALNTRGWNTPGWFMEQVGNELLWHGYPEAAREVFNQAIVWYESRVGEDDQDIEHRVGLARALFAAKRWGDAREAFANLAAEFPDVFDDGSTWNSTVDFRGHLGVIAALQGEGERAAEIRTWLHELQRPHILQGWNTLWEARIAAASGEREQAVSLLRRAATKGVELRLLHADIHFLPLRDYQPFQELIRPKG